MRKLCKSGIALLIAGILAACLAGAGAEEAEPGASDRAEYHLEVWCAAGRVPVAHINENNPLYSDGDRGGCWEKTVPGGF